VLEEERACGPQAWLLPNSHSDGIGQRRGTINPSIQILLMDKGLCLFAAAHAATAELGGCPSHYLRAQEVPGAYIMGKLACDKDD